MPLSEQEQRLLDEMERNLYQNDADFVATVGSRQVRTNYRSVVFGVLLGVIGIVVLVIGVSIRQPIVGVFGFLVMFGGVLVAVSPPRKPVARASKSSPKDAPRRSGGFMESLNERWERRQENRDS
jgi:Protein of unknown function (DUF3040)